MVFLIIHWHAWISSTIAHWYSQVTSAISTVTEVCFAPSISSLSCPVIRLQGIFALFNLLDTSHASSLRGPQYIPVTMQRYHINNFKASGVLCVTFSWQNPLFIYLFGMIFPSRIYELNRKQDQVILLKKYLTSLIVVVLVLGMFYRCL